MANITRSIALLPLSLGFAAACASSPSPSRQTGADFVGHGAGDVSACRPNGALVVHNGESIAVELLGYPKMSSAWSFGGERAQRLGSVAPGVTDTLVDVRSNVHVVFAHPGGNHAVHRPNEVNGLPMNEVKKVRFTCSQARSAD